MSFDLSKDLIDSVTKVLSEEPDEVHNEQLDEGLKIVTVGKTTKFTNKSGDILEVFSNPGKTLGFSFTIQDGNEFSIRGSDLAKFTAQLTSILEK